MGMEGELGMDVWKENNRRRESEWEGEEINECVGGWREEER